MVSPSKKSSIGAQEALDGTNPLWGEIGPAGNKTAYTHNCQRCTFAYELRARGYDVEATDYKGDDAIVNGWRRAFEGMNYEKVGARTKSQMPDKVKNKMMEYGEGSRAIVYVAWEGGKAHVFNVLYNNGRFESVDPQTGRTNVIGDYSGRCKPTKTLRARVDNLQPSRLYLDGAIKAKGR